MSLEKNKRAEKETAPNNIIYVGRKQKLNVETGRMEIVAKEVPAFIVNGGKKIMLPEGIDKGAVMPTETAELLKTWRGSEFKTPTGKSEVN